MNAFNEHVNSHLHNLRLTKCHRVHWSCISDVRCMFSSNAIPSSSVDSEVNFGDAYLSTRRWRQTGAVHALSPTLFILRACSWTSHQRRLRRLAVYLITMLPVLVIFIPSCFSPKKFSIWHTTKSILQLITLTF